jgi:hypothetical protein
MKIIIGMALAILFLSGCTQPTAAPAVPTDNSNDLPPISNPAPAPPVQPPIIEEPVETPPVEPAPVSGPQKITMTQPPTLAWTGGYADASVVEFKGKYWMYLNQFGNGKPSGVFVLSSSDGLTWKEETDIIFDGVATVRALVIGDKVYAYYPQGGAQIAPNEPAAIVGSVSSDGKTFSSVSSIKISPREGYTMDGPGVFQLEDGTFRMYFVEFEMSDVTKRKGDMWGASSSDGKTWIKDAQPTLKAEASVEGLQPWPQILHPFVTRFEGGFIMLYNSHSRIFWAYSEDGLTWEKRGKVTYNGSEIDGADVDGFWINENELRVHFGDFSEQTGGVVYMSVLRVE